MTEDILKEIADAIYSEYINDDNLMPAILTNDSLQRQNLKILDCLYQSILSSIRFGHYKRVVRYLLAFYNKCRTTFTKENRSKILNSLLEHMQT